MRARANGIELEYDTFGDPGAPTVLLVMGLGMQLIAWDEELCGAIAGRGFHVVRFDNRDAGLSTKVRGGRAPNVLTASLGSNRSASYGLGDMADDTAGLLDALEVDSAHVAGVSMGGMIGQELAIRHPRRVSSLVSVMSHTGSRRVSQPRMRALAAVLRRPPTERDAFVERMLKTFRLIGSPGFDMDEQRVRELIERSYDRCHYPVGVARQLVAILTSGNRTRALRRLRTPALVMHGAEDPLVPVRGGRATARAIPGAELLVVEGMGHDLPPDVWPRLLDGIERTAGRAIAEEEAVAWR